MKKRILASGKAGTLREIQARLASPRRAVLAQAALRPMALAPFGEIERAKFGRMPDARYSPGKGVLVKWIAIESAAPESARPARPDVAQG